MRPRPTAKEIRSWLLIAASTTGLAAGAVLAMAGNRSAADTAWALTVAVMIPPLAWMIWSALRRGQAGVDMVALLSMSGTLAVGEYLAGAIVAVMYSGGDALDSYAVGRARSSLAALLEQAPRTATVRSGGAWHTIPASEVSEGDLLMVRTGDVVPVDGRVHDREAVIDESLMTGESLPVARPPGALVRSGTTNAGPPFQLVAAHTASESSYAALVRLVENAERERAPMVRLADRYSLWFLAISATLAGSAWAASGDPVRAVAVLVVATPCPLILAAPIALIGGIARMTKHGVIVKNGAAIERLGGARTVLLDKTGTLTTGRPGISAVRLFGELGEDEAIRLAASADQASSHVLASALVAEAERRGLELATPVGADEEPGSGLVATVDGHPVAVGASRFLESRGFDVSGAWPDGMGDADGNASVLLGRDGRLVATIEMADPLRDDAGAMVAALRVAGVRNIALVTGDRLAVAERIAGRVGLDRVYAEQSAQDKLELVKASRADAALRPVVMVGDGVNDAPALAIADVGIAMGAAGSTISAETADCVITVDRVDRVARAVELGRRTLRIARQSVLIGISLSAVAMVVAALGFLPPVAGALLQEGIDVAAIVNALRVLR